VQFWLWGQGSSKPERKGDRFLSVKVTLKDWNWITSSKATDSCRQQIARDVEVGWPPLPTHARPIFVSLPTRPLSDTVVQSAEVVILAVGGEQMKGPVFARWAPLAAIPPAVQVQSSAVGTSESERERLPPGMHACTHHALAVGLLQQSAQAPNNCIGRAAGWLRSAVESARAAPMRCGHGRFPREGRWFVQPSRA
jgi:hypothetical protein